MKEAVATDRAPKAIGPYSQAVKVTRPERMLFASGQIPLDPATGALVAGTIEDEVRQVLDNLKAVIETGGFSLADVVRTTIFLADMGDFAKVNEVYAAYFLAPAPARATVAVKTLPKGARIEIDAVCVA